MLTLLKKNITSIKNVRYNCGIAGIYNPSTKNSLVNKKLNFEKMLERTKHRGTDNTSYNIYNNAMIGINRLSIVDIESGNQPLHNLENKVHIVGNGFIYNYESIMDDLKNSGYNFQTHNDFQVVPYLYDKYGLNFVDHIEGMFSFLLLRAVHRQCLHS